MKIAIIGTGYVGLVTGTCFANKGHDVTCVDVIQEKVDKINQAIPPIYEEGLEEMLKQVVKEGKLKATLDLKEAIQMSEIIFICVGTPSFSNGLLDDKYVRSAATSIAQAFEEGQEYKVVVVKSTCNPGTTTDIVKPILEKNSKLVFGKDFGIGMNPEFLREGVAVKDFLSPDRIVIGGNDEKSQQVIAKTYEGFEAPILNVDPTTAEMIKLVSNSFLAMKISFINEVANIAEKIGSDVSSVAKGVGMDERISSKFLRAGLGYGGSCITGNDFILLGNSTPEIATSEELYQRYHSNTNIRAISFDGHNSFVEEVKHFSKREYKGEIITFHTKMGRKISVTEDHPMLIENNGNLEITLAIDVREGNRLPVLTSYPVCRKKKLNVYEIVKDNVDFLKFRPLKHDLKEYKEVLYPVLRQIQESDWKVYDLVRNNYLPLKFFQYLLKKNLLPLKLDEYYIYTTQGTPTYVPTVISMDADLWRLIGYYLAEGHITYEKGKRGVRARIGFSFNSNEEEFIEDVCSILEKLKIRFSLVSKGQCTTILVSSKVLAYILDKHLNCGTDSYTKRLPALIYTENKESRFNVLKGLFRGDGCVYFHKHASAITIEYETVSKELAEGVIVLLQSLEIIPSHKEQWMEKSTKPAHIIRVTGKSQINDLKFFDQKTNAKMTDTLMVQKRDVKPMGYMKYDGFASLRINNITKKKAEIDVYSIEMESSPHTFVSTSGFIVHNCFPKDVSALYQKSKELNVPSKLLEATLEVNKTQPLRAIELLKENYEGESLKDKRIAILGLAFKPDTDDIRDAVSVPIIEKLLEEGALVYATDPVAMENFESEIENENLHLVNSIEEVLKSSDGCILVTEWKEFIDIPPEKFLELMKNPILIDGRRAYEHKRFIETEVKYKAIGLSNN
ncbi:MAG: nucleotide sugar dehydrogenase [Candidatus Heimdallarchaeaceae archaeon]